MSRGAQQNPPRVSSEDLDHAATQFLRFRDFAKNVGHGRTAVGCGLIGEVAGRILALFIPHGFVPDVNVGHMAATLFFALYLVRIFSKFRTPQSKDLADSLLDIDLLFGRGLIDESEQKRLRELALEKWRP
jgi:hypothetical protein